MRVIIAGSRTSSEVQVRAAVSACPWSGFVSAVISGTAQGADLFGERWAEEHALEVQRMPADWAQLGRGAGPARNKAMAERAHGLIAVWDGVSRGTLSMIRLARRQGLRVHIYNTATNTTESNDGSGAIAESWEDAEERAGILEFEGGLSRAEAETIAGRTVGARWSLTGSGDRGHTAATGAEKP